MLILFTMQDKIESDDEPWPHDDDDPPVEEDMSGHVPTPSPTYRIKSKS